MVESVGSSTIRTGDTRIAGVTRVAPATPAATPATPASTAAAAAATAPTLAKSMAASAPVDSDRVQQIKAAIAAGIGSLVAVGAPTSLSVRLATEHGLALYAFTRPGRVVAYSR